MESWFAEYFHPPILRMNQFPTALARPGRSGNSTAAIVNQTTAPLAGNAVKHLRLMKKEITVSRANFELTFGRRCSKFGLLHRTIH